jgi:hypothetical protein
MATRFQLKRSSVGGVIPTTGDIANAELAVNLSDRKLYTSDGSIVFEVGANLNNLSVSSNATLKGVVANGSLGAAGDVLHSNGTAIYWATDDAGVTSVASGNGLTGGPITSTGTLSVLANTGLVANSTGTFVNASYIATISANSATYLGAAGNLGNSSGIYTTGTINAASFTVGTSSITNATGFFTTGTVNGATISVGTSVVANSSRLAIGTAVGLQANGGIGSAGQMLTSNGTTAYWSTPTTGTVTSVATGNGLTGGPITSTGTVSILANSGIIANSTGTFVFANTGLVANATGVHVNTSYVATQSGVETLSAKTLKNQSIQYYNSGATSALDYTNGSHQRWAPTGTVSLTVSNWPASGVLGELLIEGINLGGATITWPTINWIKSDGTTTTTFASNGVTLLTSGTDWVFLWTRDGGTTVYGKIVR